MTRIDNESIDLVEVKELMLEEVPIDGGTVLGRHVLENIELEAIDLLASQELYIALRTHVLAREIYQDKYTVSDQKFVTLPKTWWQHFKKDVFPSRLLKRYPVRYDRIAVKFNKEVEITRRETYPMSDYDIKKGSKFSLLMGQPVIKDEVKIK